MMAVNSANNKPSSTKNMRKTAVAGGENPLQPARRGRKSATAENMASAIQIVQVYHKNEKAEHSKGIKLEAMLTRK